MTRRTLVLSLIALIGSGNLLIGKAKFNSMWAAPGLEKLSFVNKKVVAVVMTDDTSLRMSAEEALSGELTKRGVEGVASYRMIPKEELRDGQRAKVWFDKAEASGVVSMRLVDVTKEKTPTSVVWTGSPYYTTFWDYYPYGWGSTIAIIPGRNETKFVVETLIYDLAGNRLIWAGTSETTNPKDVRTVVHDIVEATADELRKRGLSRK